MDILIHNTLSRKKEVFKPLKSGKVSMYHCGPTVYNTPHIGNYRTFITNDLIRRLFEYNDYSIKQVMNITDVDDKTINGSKAEGLSLHDFTRKYEKLFLEEVESLNIKAPEHITRATEYIESMIRLINTLLEKGFAYTASDGVYLAIDKVKNYGALANLDLSKISKERIANDEYDKENPRDFSLWKFKTEEDGDNYWKAPFGEGRPGWHLECSTMAMDVLGSTIDIHTGGADLIFPHHTNEIAQSECVSGKQFVNYWMHIAFVNVGNEKMAKSKGNFFKLTDLFDQSISPLAYRYWLLTAHYRSPVNFTFESVHGAQNALIRLMKTVLGYPKNGKILTEYKGKFQECINDDLNTPEALALTWELIADARHNEADKRATIIDFDRVFGLKLDTIPEPSVESIPEEILALSEVREQARKAKDWEKADALRKEIEDRGYIVKDEAHGTEVQPQY
jgi:cysteinyl-tRNA synthetase